MVFIATLIFMVTTITLIWIWLRIKFNYWRKRGIETPTFSFVVDGMRKAFLQENSYADRDMHTYKYFKSRGLEHGGLYFLFIPMYCPTDLKIIKNVLQVDHSHFLDRGIYMNEKGDPLSAHLFSLGGSKWKALRKKLTPTFTSGKIKMMFETLLNCTVDLEKVMEEQLNSAVNIKDIMARFTTDIIGSCAFGLSCNSLQHPESEFRHKGQHIFHRNFIENARQVILYAFPELMRFINIRMIHSHVSEFFMNVIKETIAYREANDIYRKDFMHLLIQLKNKGKLEDDNQTGQNNNGMDKLTIDEIAAQAFVFFLAGYETSSSTMAFCLYELAANLHIQNEMRREIFEILQQYEGELTYEGISKMKYLEKVVCETLRKYPPLSSLYRVCTKEYNVPGTNLVLEKGMRVMIPTYGIHHDPEFYPEPEKFDPERFSEENKNSRPDFTYLPFGNGPRVCIGLRFGMLQMKVGIITLIKNYQFTVSEKTSLPLQFDPESLTMSTKGDLWLEYKRYQQS